MAAPILNLLKNPLGYDIIIIVNERKENVNERVYYSINKQRASMCE